MIVVLGAGESGTGAAILAKQKGFEVFVSDMSEIKAKYKVMLNQHDITWEEKQHSEETILKASEIIKSPGIPDKAPIICKLKAQGTPIISEIEFAARYTDAKMICITGSNGKTTTTSLIYEILSKEGLNVGLAGNIGNSLALQVAQTERDYYVIELSSFQLDNMYQFRADIAILLNITPDHLDRYEYKFENYVDAKFRITQNQTEEDTFIYWSQDPTINAKLKELPIRATLCPFGENEENKAYINNNNLIINKDMQNTLTIPLEDLALQGKHNAYNSMAAGLAAQVLNIRKSTIREALGSFSGVEHRLEYVATVRNIAFINDSKATNVNSCWYALESMRTPTVLILGGQDKGNDYSELDQLISSKVHTLVFMGTDNNKLLNHFSNKGINIIDTNNMEQAVEEAYQAANEGDTVLLSPCCASFDLFNNYEQRGQIFKQAVRNL